jgi:hypothetical protein
MATAYSSTPLAKKLGIKPGYKIRVINAPEYYFDLFTDLPDNIKVAAAGKQPKDLIHFFTKQYGELARLLPTLKNELVPNGAIWVSWPKKASKMPTDLTENMIRDIALQNGLVDIKVCAVDDVWSGLKLVIPVASRSALL